MKKLNPTIRMNLSKAQIKRYKDIILSARFTCPMPYNLTTWNTMKCPHCGGLNWNYRAYRDTEKTYLTVHCNLCNEDFCPACGERMLKDIRNLAMLFDYKIFEDLFIDTKAFP